VGSVLKEREEEMISRARMALSLSLALYVLSLSLSLWLTFRLPGAISLLLAGVGASLTRFLGAGA
jgi:hypothetical protein